MIGDHRALFRDRYFVVAYLQCASEEEIVQHAADNVTCRSLITTVSPVAPAEGSK